MKKVLFILMIIAFIFGMRHNEVREINPAPSNDDTAYEENAEENASLLNGSIKISAVGDCTLATDVNYGGSGSFVNEVSNQSNDYTYFLKNVKDYFADDNLTIVNFEGTLSENGSRANKQFAFRGKPEYVNILTSASVEAANLANNHTKDYGTVALDDTKQTLTDNNIVNFEGTDVSFFEYDGIKVGLLGINALNDVHRGLLDEAMEKVKAENPNLIIVSFHWGIERATSPSAMQTELAHKAIDNGADLVIGHHPHVLQGIEKYNGKYILYSLGNFCFGGNKNSSDKDTMIFQQTFTFENGELISDDNINIIPCSISSVRNRNNYQPTPLTGNEYERVKNKIVSYSSKLSDAELKFN
ncbi:MAG: CapA family protein [Clostridia bacterium]|nr:CapA family protein [Clostridia bacterium]